ncbi:MAG: flagellar protein FlgN, partial [Nitrospirae bacterium]|nr:flagellar protein FlgN [Nitrospirota bacterium]
MNEINSLISILEEQLKGYENLYSLLKREKEAIINFSPDDIEEVYREKDSLVLQLKLLEEERQRLVKALPFSEGKNLGIYDLYLHTGDERLPPLRSKLLSLLQGIEELNEINRTCIDRATTFLRASSSFLDVFFTEPLKGTGTVS